MTPKELKEKTAKERSELLVNFREELFHLNLKKTTGQLEKSHRIKEIKRTIARLITLAKQTVAN